jgi:predicted XRE-type DNA-binding protein
MGKMKKNLDDDSVELSSGNVFEDLGVENSEEELTKAKLAWEIHQIIKRKKLTQAKAAKMLGINQPKVSALIRRKLDGFSVERLIHFLNALEQDIDIIVRPKPKNRKRAVINVFSENTCKNIPLAAKGHF